MSEKRRLGRGLDALLPGAMESDSKVRDIPVILIKPNPFQPRSNFDETRLNELADSIREHGVVQAVIVSPTGDNEYILVAGERRFRAAKMAGLASIPALVRQFDQNAMLEIALIENLQREDLNPIEEAAAYRRLMDEFNFTQEDLARRIGKSRPAIANTVRLLSLPQPVKDAVIGGDISAGQARPLLSIQDAALQHQLALQIIGRGMTARDVEKLVNRIIQGRKPPESVPARTELSPLWEEIQSSLQRRLGTKIKINRIKNGGTIEVHFYSEEDLDRLIALLLPEGIV
jgi:ParB family transcriptional regulator, chromosome partitioning protein